MSKPFNVYLQWRPHFQDVCSRATLLRDPATTGIFHRETLLNVSLIVHARTLLFPFLQSCKIIAFIYLEMSFLVTRARVREYFEKYLTLGRKLKNLVFSIFYKQSHLYTHTHTVIAVITSDYYFIILTARTIILFYLCCSLIY